MTDFRSDTSKKDSAWAVYWFTHCTGDLGLVFLNRSTDVATSKANSLEIASDAEVKESINKEATFVGVGRLDEVDTVSDCLRLV